MSLAAFAFRQVREKFLQERQRFFLQIQAFGILAGRGLDDEDVAAGDEGEFRSSYAIPLAAGNKAAAAELKARIAATIAYVNSLDAAAFDGADTVPYNGVRPALDWWAATTKPELTILDGDRFSNGPAKAWLEAQPIRLLCAHVAPPADTLAAWRAARGAGVRLQLLR